MPSMNCIDHMISKHPAFAQAAMQSGCAKLPLGSNEVDGFLAVGDSVRVNIRLDAEGCLQASAPRLLVLHWNARGHIPTTRASSDLAELVRNVNPRQNTDLQLLTRILSAQGVSVQVVEELVQHVCVVLCNKAQRLRALQMQRAVICSSFLTPKGSLCEHLPSLSPELHLQVRSIIGTLCSLDHHCARLLVHVTTELAPHLPDATAFVTSLLRAALPLHISDPLSSFAWWQLPNTPLTQEIAFVQTSSSTQLDTLPCSGVSK
eukprot:gene29715-5149_t